jgi:hypothetical protein
VRAAWQRPAVARLRRTLFQEGAGGAGSLTHRTRPIAGEVGRRERYGARVGRPRKDEVGLAWMNSDDCELFKWILNEFDLI